MKGRSSAQSMRIIAGKYARRSIQSPDTENVRPPLTRCRRAVFDTLMPFLPRGGYLDLFGGSGSFTIEALSRGATSATVIELHPRTAALIRQNTKHVGVTEPCEVLQGDALEWIPKLAMQQRKYAVIMVAPPYYQDLEDATIALLNKHSLLQDNGIVALQYPDDQNIELIYPALQEWKTRRYGRTYFTYFETKA